VIIRCGLVEVFNVVLTDLLTNGTIVYLKSEILLQLYT